MDDGLTDPATEAARLTGSLVRSALFFSVLVNLLMLTGPVFMLQVYDRVLSSRSEETLVALALLGTLMFLAMGALDHARGRLMARRAAGLHATLERQILAAAGGPATWPGTALSDLDAVFRYRASPAFLALFDLPWVPVFLLAISLFHPALGLLALGGGLLLALVAALNQAGSASPLARAADSARRAEGIGAEISTRGETMRALGMEQAAFERWARHRGDMMESTLLAADRAGLWSTVSRTWRLYLQSAVLGLAALLVLRGELTGGAMIAASILAGRALAPVDQLIGHWPLLLRAWRGQRGLSAALAPYGEIRPARTAPQPGVPAASAPPAAARDLAGGTAEGDPDQPAPAPPVLSPGQLRAAAQAPTTRLCVRGLTVRRNGQPGNSLEDVSFDLPAGTCLGIIGPHGAGKTRLALALAGAIPVAAGSVRLPAVAPAGAGPPRRIGYLPQQAELFSGTIARNVAGMDASPDPVAVDAALQAAGAEHMVAALARGAQTPVDSAGRPLSAGQIHRIAMARALYGRAGLLILDAPDAHLDAQGLAALERSIRERCAGGGIVLLISQRPSTLALCQLTLHLDHGRARAFGPTRSILEGLTSHGHPANTAGTGACGDAPPGHPLRARPSRDAHSFAGSSPGERAPCQNAGPAPESRAGTA